MDAQHVALFIQNVEHMPLIHEKIRTAIADQGLNISSAAARCEIKYRTLHSCLNDERDVSTSLLQRISDGLNIDFNYFSDRSPKIELEGFRSQDSSIDNALKNIRDHFEGGVRRAAYEGRKVSLESFLNWWVRNNGRLENFDMVAERVDLFDVPDNDAPTIRPIRTGHDSLATKHFHLEDAAQLSHTLNGFSSSCNKKLVSAHLDAIQRGEPVITHPALDEELPNGQRFTRQYRRVLAPLYLPGGKVNLINFSEDIL
jgi:hypothetical protein